MVPAGPALALPWSRTTPANRAAEAPTAAPSHQEIAPPLGVQHLKPLLEAHQPRLRIVAPEADSLVPAGPWTLRLELSDWPLLDAGPLGIGPHLVVQLDDAPPLRLTSTSVAMPPLAPGSHRLSVFAAMPWGEAVRIPGAFAQIRLHRAAANPLAIPAPGTPQLIPLLPTATPADQPLLLDWILVDAPLQHLRGGDDSWRLRLSIDGDPLLLDRQEALWIEGLPPGRHPLVLELLDPRGEPLNPPFNSLVRELVTSADSQGPPWLSGPLTAPDLARLSGSAPPSAAAGEGEGERPPTLQGEQRDPSAAAGVPRGSGSPSQPSSANPAADGSPSTLSASPAPLNGTAGAQVGGDGSGDIPPPPARDGALQAGRQDPKLKATGANAMADLGRAEHAALAATGGGERSDPPPPNAEDSRPAPRVSPAAAPGSQVSDARNGPPLDGPSRSPEDAANSFPAVPSPAAQTQSTLAGGARAQASDPSDRPSAATTATPLQASTPVPAPESASEGQRSPGAAHREPSGAGSTTATGQAQQGRDRGATPPSTELSSLDARDQRRQADQRDRSEGDRCARDQRARADDPPKAGGPKPEAERALPAQDPTPADGGAAPLASGLPGEDDTRQSERPNSSRSVSDSAPTPSLRPRPSTPEPFDPWSSPLIAAPSTTPGRAARGIGPLDRLLRLTRP